MQTISARPMAFNVVDTSRKRGSPCEPCSWRMRGSHRVFQEENENFRTNVKGYKMGRLLKARRFSLETVSPECRQQDKPNIGWNQHCLFSGRGPPYSLPAPESPGMWPSVPFRRSF